VGSPLQLKVGDGLSMVSQAPAAKVARKTHERRTRHVVVARSTV